MSNGDPFEEVKRFRWIIRWIEGDCSLEVCEKLNQYVNECKQKEKQKNQFILEMGLNLVASLRGEDNGISGDAAKAYMDRMRNDAKAIISSMVSCIRAEVPQEKLYEIFCNVKGGWKVEENPVIDERYLSDVEMGAYLSTELGHAEAVVVMYDYFLVGYKDAGQLVAEARRNLEKIKTLKKKAEDREKSYKEAIKAEKDAEKTNDTSLAVQCLESALKNLKEMGDYRDSKERIAILEKKVEKAKIENKVYTILAWVIIIGLAIGMVCCVCM